MQIIVKYLREQWKPIHQKKISIFFLRARAHDSNDEKEQKKSIKKNRGIMNEQPLLITAPFDALSPFCIFTVIRTTYEVAFEYKYCLVCDGKCCVMIFSLINKWLSSRISSRKNGVN